MKNDKQLKKTQNKYSKIFWYNLVHLYLIKFNKLIQIQYI